MKHSFLFLFGLIPLFLIGCNTPKEENSEPVSSNIYQEEVIEVAKQQLGFQTKLIEDHGSFINPRTVEEDL